MTDIILSAGIGALSGLFIAGAGYFKSYDENHEKESFQADKFALTTILGAIVGGTSGITGMAPDVIVSLPMYAGITAVVENAIKAIIRWFSKA